MRTYFPTITPIRFVRIRSGGSRTHAQSVPLYEARENVCLCTNRLGQREIADGPVTCASCAGFVRQRNAIDVTDQILAGACV